MKKIIDRVKSLKSMLQGNQSSGGDIVLEGRREASEDRRREGRVTVQWLGVETQPSLIPEPHEGPLESLCSPR